MSFVMTGWLAYLGQRLELMHGEVREENDHVVLRSDGQLAYLGQRLELVHGEVREKDDQDVLRYDRSVSLPWAAS
jgi:hypothetical protein